MEGIILAGGMGTRLQSVVSDVPKCMASVAGQPFLSYLLNVLQEAGFKHIILSLGYKSEVIEAWLRLNPFDMQISTVVEDHPLGTGGAVKLALTAATQSHVFILNGDTFLAVDYVRMLRFHREKQADATLALRTMTDFDRYGVVEMNDRSEIIAFREKRYCRSGLINGGTYLLNSEELNDYPEKFSLEKDYFEKRVAGHGLAGFVTDGYFIDIGIPEDYEQAQTDFANGRYKTL
ncbi:nucleotidyltransferase family protein [Parabacteroides sp. PF5-9]|uniref:nucleotidyltransferase family protein n=1 Tax=Parabacteroides sp. PF5-9 TaxID=1742404 RepID=UPI0024739162|nr:nucleotidyltransferase family protein [Parabacteroides sp. PF5-9]MDH6358713.1 D-glycero-alpha-D-manno-heptose 1-phosphate guanylyltransferase [Parabacteroides sp. PF5-9]